MTQWIESSNVKQDGTPVTRSINISGMDTEIWFTDQAYAEVADDVADLLASQFDSITKVAEPSSPGTYYGDAGENTTVEIVLPDGAWDHITAETGDVDELDSQVVSTDKQRTNLQNVAPQTTANALPRDKELGLTPIYCDQHVVPGRIIGAGYFSDPPYEATIDGSVDSYNPEDDTTDSSINLDSDYNARVGMIYDDSIFVARNDSAEMRIYRAPDYQSVFENGGTLQYERVLTGQTGSTIQNSGGNSPMPFDVNPETGTLLVGEETPDNDEAALYRSTDNGRNWNEVYRTTGQKYEYHSLAKDPYSDMWVATLGDSGEDRFIVSTDDGKAGTWSEEPMGLTPTSQGFGLDFDEEFVYICQDQGGSAYHGPWVYRKSDGATGLLCDHNPRMEFEAPNWIEYGLIHDGDANDTYILADDRTSSGSLHLYRVHGIGGRPQHVAIVDGTTLLQTPNYVAASTDMFSKRDFMDLA